LSAAPDESSHLVPGYRLDRYELLCPLADGGMASVWVARQRGKHGFEKLVAVKTILEKYASDPRFQEMFLDEARLAARVEHMNVAQIFDLGEEHDILYLVMEYVDGDALSKLNRACRKKGVAIPTGIVLRLLADACAGLHEAHELKGPDGKLLEVVHRDISPHNILVGTKGIAKVIDFGIAKARDRAGQDTSAGVLKGKIQYMAPEQALGRPVDRRADVWAIGASLYHLLSGKPPYEADNQLATLQLLASGKPPAPLSPNVHAAIQAIVKKALSHDPANRYATAAEMRVAMEAAMINASVRTTASDVAAFANEHLAERNAQRRSAIDIALAAAVERKRVEELLRPPSDLSSSGVRSATPIGTAELRVARVASDARAASANVATIPGVRLSMTTPGAVPIPDGRFSLPQLPSSHGQVTNTSLLMLPRSRWPIFGAFGAALLLVVGVIVFATSADPQIKVRASLFPVIVLPTARALPAAPPATTATSNIPTVALTSLPTVDDTPTPPPPATPATHHAAASTPAPASKPRASTHIDDGF
jgi:serine/threonine protein kinase